MWQGHSRRGLHGWAGVTPLPLSVRIEGVFLLSSLKACYRHTHMLSVQIQLLSRHVPLEFLEGGGVLVLLHTAWT